MYVCSVYLHDVHKFSELFVLVSRKINLPILSFRDFPQYHFQWMRLQELNPHLI